MRTGGKSATLEGIINRQALTGLEIKIGILS